MLRRFFALRLLGLERELDLRDLSADFVEQAPIDAHLPRFSIHGLIKDLLDSIEQEDRTDVVRVRCRRL